MRGTDMCDATVARSVYAVYASPAWGFLALLDLAAIYAGLAVLAGVAIVVLRRGERGPI